MSKTITQISNLLVASRDLHQLVLANTRLGIAVDRDLANQCAKRYEQAARPVDAMLAAVEKQASSRIQSSDLESNHSLSDEPQFSPRG